MPVPFEILRLGPDDPRALAWLWEHWGTTWSLRQVVPAPLAGIEAALPDMHAAFRCRFWAADWTPWPALGAVRRRWPELSVAVQPSYGLEETEAAGRGPGVLRRPAQAGSGGSGQQDGPHLMGHDDERHALPAHAASRLAVRRRRGAKGPKQEMATGRTDEQKTPLVAKAFDAASLFGACSAKPIWASGHMYVASKAEHMTALVP